MNKFCQNYRKKTLSLFLIVLVSVFLGFLPSRVSARTVEMPESGSLLTEGNYNNLVEADVGLGARLESEGSWGALTWKTPDKTIGIGSAFASDGRYIYVVRGYGDVLFWRYDSVTDTWKDLKNLPRSVYYGADLQHLNGYIYALFGGYQKTFARYSIAEDSWEMLTEYPELTWTGTSMTSDGTNLYAITGNNTQSFYKYSVASDSWSPLAGSLLTLGAGADLVHVNGYIYTPRGASSNVFYRYSIAGNSWAIMQPLPVTMTVDCDITTDGTSIFVARQNSSNLFYRYNIDSGGGVGSWTQLASSPLLASLAGVQYLSHDGYVYFFQGNNTLNFWKYDISANNFVGIPDAPGTLGLGSDSYYYDGNVYVVRGGNTATFYRYNLATNAWSTLTNAPGVLNSDTRGVLVGSSIYMFRGTGGNQLYRYDINSGSWDITLANAPATVNYGAALAYPGSGSYIYATRGTNTRTFWRYNITTNGWSIVGEEPPLPPDLPLGFTATYGSTLFANETDVFFTTGLAVKKILRYNIASQVWSLAGELPFSPYYGNDTEYFGGDKVLALAGFYSDELWEYTISTNSWSQLKSLPTYDPREIGPWSGASIVHMGSGRYLVTRGNTRADVLSYTSGEKDYVTHGTWISEVYDLIHVENWESVDIDAVLPGGTSLGVETRTSSNGSEWSNWGTLVSSNVVSPEGRFLQIRAILFASADGTKSPVLKSIKINYSSDENPPSVPQNFEGFSRHVDGEKLISGEGYRHLEPYFTWEDSADDESSVVGYYVYFGSSEDADPVNEGVFQANSSYRIYEAMEIGVNYLRVVAEDESGNTSEAVTGFEYDYVGVGPYLSLDVDSSEMGGTGSGFQIVNDLLKLEQRQGGFWLQERITPPPAVLSSSAKNVAYVESSNKLYVTGNTGAFYEYDISNNVWYTRANTPAAVGAGGGVVEGPNGFLYAMQGTNLNTFWQYNIAANTWSAEISNLPLAVGAGGSMVFDGSQYIYILRGNASDYFWRYDCFEDSWESLTRVDFGAPANNINNNVTTGGGLAIDRVNRKIYATQGNWLAGFSVYDIDMNAWTVLNTIPSLPNDGSSLTYDPGTQSLYYQGGNLQPYFFRYDIVEEEWTELSIMPLGLGAGGGVHRAGNFLYAIRGASTNTIYKYDIEKNSWLIPQRGLFGREYQGANLLAAGYGADIIKGDNDFFYITRGNYGDEFIRWDEKTGELARLAKVPMGLYVGGSLVYESKNNKIYATAGTHYAGFFVYDIATNVWQEIITDPLPFVANAGSSMVFDGDSYIYFTRGGSQAHFYRYDIEGNAGARWTILGSVPATIGAGSEMLLRDNYIYTLRGLNVVNSPFYRYNLSTGGPWESTVAPSTFQLNADGFLVDGNNGYFYGTRGSNTSEFYKYSVSGDSWTQLGDAPANITTGGAGESNMDYAMHVIAGAGTNTYNDGLYTYIFESENSSFVPEAEYISQSHDLESVYRWGDIAFEYDIKENTNIRIETSSSSDNSNWSDWSEVARRKERGDSVLYKINSEPNRYLKVRILLDSGEGIRSPEVSNYKINYYQDETPPSNPNILGIAAKSVQESGVTLESGNWYNFSTPYLEWPEAEEDMGSSDGVNGSGVKGYYVYWGTESGGKPEDEGIFMEGNNFTPTSLVNGKTYSLRIRTVDNADNLSESILNAFVYKYDSRGPNAPTALTVDPSGYTANNSFAFSWEPAATGGPQIVSYCYKTGATSGRHSEDQCIDGVSVKNIPSYRVGINTFSVRAKDEAGNLGSYATISYFYVDAANAPAPPTNLKVAPVINTQNSFGFSWDPPAPGSFYGSEGNLSYLYSINAIPTEHSTSATSLRYLNPGAYATIPGENVFYIVSKDEAGNVNYSHYEQVSFFANTVAPGIPMNIEIGDVSVKANESWRLAISWDEPLDEGSGIAGYRVYRSVDGENFDFHTFTGGSSLVDSKLVQQIHYYKVKACDSTNNCGAFSEMVSMYPDGKYYESAELIVPPVVSNITPKKATISWITARTSDSRIAYGTEPGEYFEEEVSNSEQVVEHILTIQNLSPGTKYYYVTRWIDEDGNLGESEEGEFETSPPPSIEEPVVKSVGLDSALIGFKTKDALKVRIFYGETSAFGGMLEVNTGLYEGDHNVQLTDLKDGTKYFFKINTFDIDNSEYEGEIHSFETLPRPQISKAKVFQIAGTASASLLVEWDVNTPVSSIVTYYPVSNPEKALDEVNVALKRGKHRMILLNLEPNTQYGVIVSGRDFMGNEATSEIMNFTTALDTRAPQIFDLEVASEIIGTGPEATAQLVVSYKTDEPATSQIEYGEGTGTVYAQKTQEDTTLAENHIVIVSGLVPGRVYHLRAISNDASDNIGYSVDTVIVTKAATENALDLVINKLVSIFSFLERN